MVDGKTWKYDYYKIYHYTKDYGVTKNPANFLIVFTKANKNLKNAPEETLQISLFHAPQKAKKFEASDIDLAFTSDLFGKNALMLKHSKLICLQQQILVITRRQKHQRNYQVVFRLKPKRFCVQNVQT